MPPPTAFISYSWDNDAHNDWVKRLAARLRSQGIKSILDRWHVVPGDPLPAFMETSIRESDFVIAVCTPKYKEKMDNRTGGAGYEGEMMSAEASTLRNNRKFIAVLRSGTPETALPSWRTASYWIDLRGDPYSELHYLDLLQTLHGARETAPDIGSDFPDWSARKASPYPLQPDRAPPPTEAQLPPVLKASELPPAVHFDQAVSGETATPDTGSHPSEAIAVVSTPERPEEPARPPLSKTRGLRRWWRLTWRRAAVAAVLLAVIASGYLFFESPRGQIIFNRLRLVLNPASAVTWGNLAWSYRAIDDFTEAERCFDKAVRLEPEDGERHSSRAILLMNMADSQEPELKSAERIRLGEKAIADFDRAFALGYDMIYGHMEKATLLIKTGHPELAIPELNGAVKSYEEVVQKTRRDLSWMRGEAYFLRGVAYLRKGEGEKADADFRKAQEFKYWRNVETFHDY